MNILIVESAAEARTLQLLLGDGWNELAAGGHVRTLPYVLQERVREEAA